MTLYTNIKSLIPGQYKDSSNLNKLLEVLSTPFDDLVAVFASLKNILNLELAEGSQLDLIGQIIEEKRNGRSDSDYLKGIKFKTFKNTSKGFVDDVVKTLTLITSATKVIYSDNPPASYTIYTNGIDLNDDIKFLIDKITAAGISLTIYASKGEIPFIMNDLITEKRNLVDNQDLQIIDDASNNIIVDYLLLSDNLKILFGGKGMGVLDENQQIVDGGKLNIII